LPTWVSSVGVGDVGEYSPLSSLSTNRLHDFCENTPADAQLGPNMIG
jgi:hypothetical protein